jgi:mannose-6-phosphate isomerase-like protein (cupin superfamily)
MTSIVSKPWGFYEVLEKGPNYLIKRITVSPDGVLSLQSHLHRSEHWVIVEGVADIIIDSEVYTLTTNNNIFIPKKSKHRLSNTGQKNLVVIEIWFGEITDEDDIVRYEDKYNRN